MICSQLMFCRDRFENLMPLDISNFENICFRCKIFTAHSISYHSFLQDCNVNSLETKLSSMQHLLNQVEVEKSKANHLFATVDSHLKMIARLNLFHIYCLSFENSFFPSAHLRIFINIFFLFTLSGYYKN